MDSFTDTTIPRELHHFINCSAKCRDFAKVARGRIGRIQNVIAVADSGNTCSVGGRCDRIRVADVDRFVVFAVDDQDRRLDSADVCQHIVRVGIRFLFGQPPGSNSQCLAGSGRGRLKITLLA